jgi:type II secretion system (T2SS) protein G
VLTLRVSLFSVLVIASAAQVKAELSAKQVRKLVSRAAGMELPTRAVRVKGISSTGQSTAEAVAEVETAFRLDRNEQEEWRVAEIRTGANYWEEVNLIAQAIGVEAEQDNCNSPEVALSTTGSDPGVRRARCLIASLIGVKLPSDEVRVKDISALAIPHSSRPSVVVVAMVQAQFRFSMVQGGQWQASEIRTGNRQWISLDLVANGLNTQKRASARAELETLVKALETFRRERGFYVLADSEAVLVDHLSPHYLISVIRLDPWHRPYRYSGKPNHFSLSSVGPDGKENTSDDIVLTSPIR